MKLLCFKKWLMMAVFLLSLDEGLVAVKTALENATVNFPVNFAAKYKLTINSHMQCPSKFDILVYDSILQRFCILGISQLP